MQSAKCEEFQDKGLDLQYVALGGRATPPKTSRVTPKRRAVFGAVAITDQRGLGLLESPSSLTRLGGDVFV